MGSNRFRRLLVGPWNRKLSETIGREGGGCRKIKSRNWESRKLKLPRRTTGQRDRVVLGATPSGTPPFAPLKGRDVVTNCILPRFFLKIPVTFAVTTRDKAVTTGKKRHNDTTRLGGPERQLYCVFCGEKGDSSRTVVPRPVLPRVYCGLGAYRYGPGESTN